MLKRYEKAAIAWITATAYLTVRFPEIGRRMVERRYANAGSCNERPQRGCSASSKQVLYGSAKHWQLETVCTCP